MPLLFRLGLLVTVAGDEALDVNVLRGDKAKAGEGGGEGDS